MKISVFENKCVVCEKDISDKSLNVKYCSNICGNKARNKKWRDNNKDAIKKKNFRDNSNTIARILIRAKSRAKLSGIPFNLELSDLELPEYCPVLGIKLNPHQGKKGYFPDSPSLDKIYPNKGYTKGNVRIISQRANLLKNDATIEELQLVIDDLKKLYGETT